MTHGGDGESYMTMLYGTVWNDTKQRRQRLSDSLLPKCESLFFFMLTVFYKLMSFILGTEYLAFICIDQTRLYQLKAFALFHTLISHGTHNG